MKQLSFSDAEYGGKRKRTRREVFLAEMSRVVPWKGLEAVIEPHYPKAGLGRRPYALSTMLRIHCLQQWYALSDPAMEEELYEIASMRQFAGLSLAGGSVPDETTILNFRHLLERHGLAVRIFDAVKAHIGADAESGLVHTVAGTPANVADITKADDLLHGAESMAFGDAGYTGIDKRPDRKHTAEWHVALKAGKRRALKGSALVYRLQFLGHRVEPYAALGTG